MKTTESN